MAAIVTVLDVLFILLPDRAESETENRMLQQFPKLNFNTLTSGRFESQFDKYIADQFPFRDSWTSLEATIARLAGNTMSNGIFLAKDGYLIQKFDEPDEEEYRSVLSGYVNVAQSYPDLNIYAMVVPTAAGVLKDLLPANAFSYVSGDENAYLDRLYEDLNAAGITTADVRNALKQLNDSGVQTYYRTDHHWTTDAAYEAYKNFAQIAGTSGDAKIYDRMLLTDSFQGTLSASSGFRTSMTEDMYIYIPAEGQETEYVMINLDDGSRSASVYDTSFLDTRDKYAVFMGGNHGEVKIETSAGTGRKLLVIKDSYANSFIPFLIPDFDTIVVIDPRYFQSDMDQVIRSEEITDILFLNNTGT